MSAPLISVIIPTYNCAHYLGDAIESAFSQDYPRLEIIVVDDGSTDDTATLLATFGERLRKTHQSNGGIGSARNTGLTLASGEFIAYLDADDLYVPGKLTRQMACFDADPELECVQGQLIQFVSPELDADFAATLAVDTSRPLAAPMASTTLIKRQALERVGPWSTELTVGTDLDWYARVQEKLVKCLMLDEVLLHRRVHRTNTNLVHAADKNERLHVIKAMLDRRRAQQRDTQ
ncbi:MAG: glycosyltransferase family 2 protein [Pseudomonadales bacterium]|nr:glycosyltransferase family 2 protein [Pseudomonadales bacterium]